MESQAFKIFDIFVDLVFALDIFITFRTCFIDDSGVEYDSPLDIAKNYIKGQFTIDLLATLPMDVIIHSLLGEGKDADKDKNL